MSFGFVKRIWNNDMSEQAKKQKILDSLYHHCQTRTYTSKDVLKKVLQDLNVFIPPEKEEKLLDVVRDYKNTGKNLELTIEAVYTVLYGNNTSSTNSWDNND
jgi:predicted nucleotide-binding protein (sugar kinase/HSP70/actin superfamily)